jgi:hypothetical protein
MTDECRAQHAVLLKRSEELQRRTKELANQDRQFSQTDFDDLKEQLESHRAALEDFVSRCIRPYQRQASTM